MYFGQIDGFGEIILAKLRIWRNGFGEIEDLAKVFWPNLMIW